MKRALILIAPTVIAFAAAAVPASALTDRVHPPKPFMPVESVAGEAKEQSAPGTGFGGDVNVFTPPEPPPGATNANGGPHRP